MLKHFSIIVIILLVLLIITTTGCDNGPTITYENRTPYSIWIEVDVVDHDFTGWHQPSEKITDEGPIQPGASEAWMYIDIPLGRELGEHFGKYVISAIVKDAPDSSGEVIYQKIFTWTELNEMDWKVVIEENIEK